LACGHAKPKPAADVPAATSESDAGDSTASTTGASDAGAPGSTDSELPALGADETKSESGGSLSMLQGNEEGAKAMLAQFVAPNADYLALTRSLRPTKEDYVTMFDAKTASKVEASQAKEWNTNKAVIKPKPGQTEIKVWAATGAELAKGTGNAKEFPAEYKKLGKHLAPALTFFRFKFVEPGKDTGTAYDGLAFVQGHWAIAPKFWKALEGKGAKDDDSDASPPPAKTKPKGGKKKKK
jgi:hypothetical protein